VYGLIYVTSRGPKHIFFINRTKIAQTVTQTEVDSSS
jgi:hypothetical protein